MAEQLELSPRLGDALTASALFATASTARISLISISRMPYGMARDRALLPMLTRLAPVRNTPWVAALVYRVTAGALGLLLWRPAWLRDWLGR